MSTSITADRCKYVVNNDNVKDALRYLKRTYNIKGAIQTADYGGKAKLVFPALNGVFDGEVDNCWCDDVEEFIEDWCEPESYATFRCNDCFSWVIVYKEDDGTLAIIEKDCDNPFEELCNIFDNNQKVLKL